MTPRIAVKGQIGFFAWFLPLGVVGLAAGIAMLDRQFVGGILLSTFATLGFLLPGAAGIYFALVPAYIVDKNGLTVQGVGLIPWVEVEKIDLVTVRNITLIGVTVSNPAALQARISKCRKLLTQSKAWPHRDVYLPLFPISVPPHQVVETIGQYKEVAPNHTIERDAPQAARPHSER